MRGSELNLKVNVPDITSFPPDSGNIDTTETEVDIGTKAKRTKEFKLSPKLKETVLGRNSFVNSTFQVPIMRQESKTQYVKDEEVTVDGKVKWKKAVYDSDYAPMVKFYTWPQNRKDICALSPRALQILVWIGMSIDNGNDYIEVTRDNCMKELNITSHTTFLSAVKELYKMNFIAPTGQSKDSYWINPHYLFKGDRLESFKENRVLAYNYTSDNELR